MLLSCKCLNIHLEVEAAPTSELVDVHTLPLHAALSQDVFFNQDLRQVLRLSKVTKMLPCLVQQRIMDSWSMEQCLNCGVHTHAIMNGERGPTCILVNAHLLASADVEALKKDNAFSKVYKVVVFPPAEAERRYDYLPAEVEKTIRTLKQKADECIRQESVHTEERVRFFTEQQAQLLEDFKERARADHKLLMRVLLRHQLGGGVSPSAVAPVAMAMVHTGAIPRRSTNDEQLRKVPDDFDRIKTPSPQNKSGHIILDDTPSMRRHTPLQKKNSLDAECIFALEGMDDEEDGTQPGEHSDGEDNGIPIKQTRPPGRQHSQQEYVIAKSLPMQIPVLMSAMRSHINDDSDEDTIQAENAKDIAASIQALARSVNGDTVFGDLPRPRCRTNIM